MPQLEDDIRTALAPLALGRQVSAIEAATGETRIVLEVNPAEGAKLEGLRQQVEALAAAVPGAGTVTVIMTAEKPPAKPAKTVSPSQPIPGVKHIVAVASGKGGVGKSTTAVNLALALVANGLRVGLLDADIYGPSIPKLLNIDGQPQVVGDKQMAPPEIHGLKAISIGLLIPAEKAAIWRGAMVQGAITQLLRQVVWGELDILVVDLPPGTGDAQLTLVQNVPLAGAVIVSTPQDLALIDARKGVAMFQRLDVPVLGLIENMSYFCCPNCHHRSEIFAHGGARAEAERLGVPLLAEIPLDMKLRESSDAGLPIVVGEPEGKLAGVYREVARVVWEAIEGT
jgi:ATP-binding protein involved in chromosome partitioning